MKTAFLILLASVGTASADDYISGYNSGYYSGPAPQSEASQYGRGYGDGAYDADQEDAHARQASEEFEAAQAREQERDYRAISGEDAK